MAYERKHLRWENNKTPDNTAKTGFYDATLAAGADNKWSDITDATGAGYFAYADIPAGGAVLTIKHDPVSGTDPEVGIALVNQRVLNDGTRTTRAVQLVAPVAFSTDSV